MNPAVTTVDKFCNPVLPPFIGGCGNADKNAGLAAAGRWISSLVSLFLIITSIAALLFLVLGGIAWVTSEGEKSKLEEARNRVTHAIVGLVVVAAAWSMWLLVGKFFGIDFTAIPFPTMNP
jgi:cytochrome bd-type quinol oxidase subunit 2